MTAAQRREEEEVGSVCIAAWRSERYQEPAVCGLGWTECLAEAEKTNARGWWSVCLAGVRSSVPEIDV